MSPPSPHLAFAQALRRLAPLTDTEVDALYAHARRRTLAAGEYFLHAGDRATHGALVLAGALREYWTLDDGGERTKSFAAEGDLIGSLSDLLSDAPSRSHVQAVTAAEVVAVPWVEVEQLAASSAAWTAVARRLAERLYLAKAEREWELIVLDAEARYTRFLARWPGLEARVTQVMVASYLGVTPEHLSRLRRRRRADPTTTR